MPAKIHFQEPTQRRKPEPVTVTRPHPLAWAIALNLAGGDSHRLRIINATTVLVS
jgi:hypothetical protein